MKIFVKATIMQTNLDELLPLAEWVKNEGLDGLSLSPLEETFATATPNARWFESSPLWVRDLQKLDAVIDRLKELTGTRGPIFNSQAHLESMKDYFRDPTIPTPPDFKCHVGQDHFRVGVNGDVVMCPFMGSIGNLTKSEPWEIWKSEDAKDRRGDILGCRKKCLIACLYKRNLGEYAGILRKLV